MNKDLLPLLKQEYGYLFEDELIEDINNNGQLYKIPEGETIIEYGQNLRRIPLILNGAIKILRLDAMGDELLIYYLEKGETCTMTMTCCMGQKKSEIKAVAETEVEFISVPVEKMKDWTKKYESWMAFVFDSYNNRFDEMMQSIDSLAFGNMHDRLVKYLKDQVMIRKTTTLDQSHQDIAYDLHTSRVVISRLLKNLEREGIIKLGRNKISVLNF
jgi:CRP/FNR family transcriptional regulator